MTNTHRPTPASDIDPTASYAAFLKEEGNPYIAHQFGILTGATCLSALNNSPCPERLEFYLL